jgi:hypothetical protein
MIDELTIRRCDGLQVQSLIGAELYRELQIGENKLPTMTTGTRRGLIYKIERIYGLRDVSQEQRFGDRSVWLIRQIEVHINDLIRSYMRPHARINRNFIGRHWNLTHPVQVLYSAAKVENRGY